MKINLKALSAIGLLTAAGAAMAADEPAAPAAPTGPSLASVLEASGITATGYVDGTYVYSSGAGSGHAFDVYHDSFQLNQAALTIAFQPKEGFGALVNVIGGSDAQHIPPGGPGSDLIIPQAFVQYASGIVTVSAGRLLTLAGAEVIAPTGNTNVTRSLLFFSEPLTHTGVRVAIAPSEVIGFTLGVNNGWNSTSVSGPSGKTAELGFSFVPSKAFSLAVQGYFGKDPAAQAQRKLVDLVATYNATDALSFVLSYDWGSQDSNVPGASSADWSGVAAYANIALTSEMRLSVRGEYFDDKAGAGLALSGVDQKVKELTVTFGYAPAKSFELRLEGRYDSAGNPIFADVSGPNKDSQTEFVVEGVYKF